MSPFIHRRLRARAAALLVGTLVLAACSPAAAPAPAATSAPKPAATSAPAATASAGQTPAAQAPAGGTTAPAPAAQPTAAATTAAAQPAQGKSGGTLTVGTNQDVLTLDLPNYRSTQDLLIGGLVFDTLVTYDKDAKIQPGLAQSWKQVDPTTYQFTLRKGVKFTDGTPADANAVKAHFERSMKALKGQRFYDMIDTITADSPEQVTFKLKNPYAPFLGNVAFETGGIQSPASIAQYGDDIIHHPVGTGPYKLTEWVPGQRMTFERNTDYWGPVPKLDKIVIRYIQDDSTRMAALQAGEVDVIQNVPPAQVTDIKSSSTLQLITGPYAQTVWLGFTASNQYLKDARVRKAIAMVVPRHDLVQSVLEGQVREATGFIPPELEPSKVTPITGDVASAKQLLADAGYPNGFQIPLWTTNGTYLGDKEMAQALQEPLKGIGIDAQVKVMDYSAYIDGMNRHEAGLFILGWAHTSAPDSMLRGVFQSKSAANWSDYKNPEIDSLLDKAIAQPTYDGAIAVWQQTDQDLVNDPAGVPIYWSNLLYGASRKVHNFYPTPFGQWDAIANTWVE